MSTHGHPPGGRAATAAASAPASNTMRFARAEHAKAQALHDELARAEADYQRLRHAWLRLAREEPDNEVALAMVGADMQRAQARLQQLTQPQRAYGAEAGAGRAPEEKH